MTQLKKPRRRKSEVDASKFYVNNKQFFEALVERKELLQSNPNLQITDYIADCIMKICTGLSKKFQFASSVNALYKEDMIGDAIVICLLAVDKFDLTSTKNPFSYFTTCAQNAFYGRINSEREFMNIKIKSLITMLDESIGCDGVDDELVNLFSTDTEYIAELRSKEFSYDAERAAHRTNIKMQSDIKKMAALNAAGIIPELGESD
jgi:DNA-directed RNA polymerase specialized sigma24 family protein